MGSRANEGRASDHCSGNKRPGPRYALPGQTAAATHPGGVSSHIVPVSLPRLVASFHAPENLMGYMQCSAQTNPGFQRPGTRWGQRQLERRTHKVTRREQAI